MVRTLHALMSSDTSEHTLCGAHTLSGPGRWWHGGGLRGRGMMGSILRAGGGPAEACHCDTGRWPVGGGTLHHQLQ